MLGRNRDADTTTTTDERARFDDVEDTQVVSRDEAAGVDEEQARRDRFGGINWGAG